MTSTTSGQEAENVKTKLFINPYFLHYKNRRQFCWLRPGGLAAGYREGLVLGAHGEEDPGPAALSVLRLVSEWRTKGEAAGQPGAAAGRQGRGLHRHPQQLLQGRDCLARH